MADGSHITIRTSTMAEEAYLDSPRSSALPSPPQSPVSDSGSSFPSDMHSSFFFSSAAPSSPGSRAASHAGDLIIPSLRLPSAARKSPSGSDNNKSYIGNLDLLVIGARHSGKRFLSELIAEDEDIHDVSPSWEQISNGVLLRASTAWVDGSDKNGVPCHIPAQNVRITVLPGYDPSDDAELILRSTNAIIYESFKKLNALVNPNGPPSVSLVSLCSGMKTPIFCALLFLLPTTPRPLDLYLLQALGSTIPIIPQHHPRSEHQIRLPENVIPRCSFFRPKSLSALRNGLFHEPETLDRLRMEASQRFVTWREIERLADHVRQQLTPIVHDETVSWMDQQMKVEWHAELSNALASAEESSSHNCQEFAEATLKGLDPFNSLDPLHLPSLISLALSLFVPFRNRIWDGVRKEGFAVALVGGICIGFGIGFAYGQRVIG